MLVFSATFLGGLNIAQGQTPKTLFWEPEFDVTLPSHNEWKFSFGIANRYLFYSEANGEQIKKNEQQYLELNHLTSYRLGENSTGGLGIRYRFIEAFEDSRHDELRITQQFSYKHRGIFLTPAHRLRFEQRFRELTTYRVRYRFGISKPLNKNFSLSLSTEFLYSMIKDLRPQIGHYFAFLIGNSSFENLNLRIGAELRRENYTSAPVSEFYIYSGASLQL